MPIYFGVYNGTRNDQKVAKPIGTYTAPILISAIEMQRDPQEKLAFARIAYKAGQISDELLKKYEG